MYFLAPAKYRWAVLLVASYYFYMSWNVQYVFLILFTTATSFWSSIKIYDSKSTSVQKYFLWFSIFSSLLVLFFFKYFNFVVDTINNISSNNFDALSILLPVGISFYTFQTLSYTIDVYKGKIRPERHFGKYALFVSFFPQLVAGPIERSQDLMPQFHKTHLLKVDNIIIGLKFALIGFFMKLVVADRLSLYVDSVYSNANVHSGGTMWLATFSFAFQILCDFAGYSIIAKGVAKILGYDLMQNFRRPYFASSFKDFWKRWHISLSSWFMDYVYIPLGGSRVVFGRQMFNLLLTFLVSGLWHGANWTFVVWGGLHGIYLITEKFFNLVPKEQNMSFIVRLIRALCVFILVCFAWIFFRASSVSEAFYIISSSFNFENSIFLDKPTLFFGSIGVLVLLFIDGISEKKGDTCWLYNNSISYRTLGFFGFLLISTLFIGVFDGGEFIYFQF